MNPLVDVLPDHITNTDRLPSPVGHRVPMIATVFVILLAAVSWSYRWSGPIDLRYDAGVYYVLGTSLATDGEYRISAEPGAPEGIQYPPGLPALVALHQWALGTTDPVVVGPWLKRTYAVLFVAFAVALLRLSCAYLGTGWGTVASVLCLVQLNTVYFSNLLFTELPYTLVSVGLALTLANQWMNARWWRREPAGFALVAAGFLLRTAGLALMAAWVAEALFRRQWRLGAVRAALAMMPFVAWQLHVSAVEHSAEYHAPAYAYQRAPYQFYNVSYAENLKLVDPFQPELGRMTLQTLVARVGANLAALPLAVGEAASESRGMWSAPVKTLFYPGRKTVPWVDNVALVPVAIVAALAFAGWIILLRTRAWFPVWLIVGSVGLVCSTPWPQQFLRYLAPLAPFIAIAFTLGLVSSVRALQRMKRGAARILGWSALTAMAGGVVVAHAYATANGIQSLRRVQPATPSNLDPAWSTRRWLYYDQGWADWDRAVAWIAGNSAPDAIVATDAPHLCYLMTGRRAVMPPMEADAGKAARLLADVPVAFLVIDELDFTDISRRYAAPAVARDSAGWKEVKRFNKTIIFERNERP